MSCLSAKLCRNFPLGTCRFGEHCSYLHVQPTNNSTTQYPSPMLTMHLTSHASPGVSGPSRPAEDRGRRPSATTKRLSPPRHNYVESDGLGYELWRSGVREDSSRPPAPHSTPTILADVALPHDDAYADPALRFYSNVPSEWVPMWPTQVQPPPLFAPPPAQAAVLPQSLARKEASPSAASSSRRHSPTSKSARHRNQYFKSEFTPPFSGRVRSELGADVCLECSQTMQVLQGAHGMHQR